MEFLKIILGFLLSLIMSAFIIYLAAKLFGEKEGFGTAILAAFIGSLIFSLTYYFIDIGWIASLISGIVWLIALGSLYKMGWLKSFVVTIFIWIFALIVSLLLPILVGLI